MDITASQSDSIFETPQLLADAARSITQTNAAYTEIQRAAVREAVRAVIAEIQAGIVDIYTQTPSWQLPAVANCLTIVNMIAAKYEE